MTPSAPTLFRRARAVWHRAMGWVCYRVGAFERARSQFECVLRLVAGDDFSAYVGLGRVAYKLGDYVGWKRECGHARRTSPERYARLRHPFELFEAQTCQGAGPSALNPFAAGRERFAGEGLGARADGTGSSRIVTGGPDVQSVDPGSTADLAAPDCDDCTSDLERARFRELGPLPADAAARLDVDELVRRLSG